MPPLATNKKALAGNTVLEKLEAGVVLTGPEVKSVKLGRLNLRGSYVSVDGQSQVWLMNAHVSAYPPAGAAQAGYDPTQRRKLLLSKQEIDHLRGRVHEKGLTILPLSVYTKGSLIKLEIGLVRGKKLFEKRETIKKRDIDRQIRQRLRRR